MAFGSGINTGGKTIWGNKRVVIGTWSAGGATTGEINTGLKYVDAFFPTEKGTTPGQTNVKVNENFPFVTGTVTIACTSGTVGQWIAVGH
jgi:hypothetical protein|tara:strand:+ start:3045 stop:3314 length:270 start_codon:yes stop_codon:yes gene_type:complete